MTRLLLIFLLVLFFTLPLFAQSVDTAWVRRYNGTGNGAEGNNSVTMVVDDSGYIYVTGDSYGGAATSDDFATIKYKPNGDTAWVRRYDGPGNSQDWASAIAVDGSGNVYVTGLSSVNEAPGDYVTTKYYLNGDTAWVRRYNGPGNDVDYATAIAVDGSGNVYVTGWSIGSGTSSDYATIKYYPNGDSAWVRRYNGPGNSGDQASAMAVDGSGNVYVTGCSIGSGTGYDYATIKYNPAGNQLWVKRYNGPGNDVDYATAIAVDDSGNVYVTGCSIGSGTSYDYASLKYDPAGTQLWEKRYNGPGNDYDGASAIAVDGSGNVYVTGTSQDTTDYSATIKYVQFLRGDANSDKKVTVADIVYLVSYLFKHGPAPTPIQSGDANCDGKVTVSDIVYLVAYLFKHGPVPCI